MPFNLENIKECPRKLIFIMKIFIMNLFGKLKKICTEFDLSACGSLLLYQVYLVT